MHRRRPCKSRNAKALAYWMCIAIVLTGAVAGSVFAGDTPPGQDVLRATLGNGLQVVVIRSALAPVATVMMNYLVGSREAPEAFPGMAHAQEHMMFRGSPGLSADQLSDIIALMGGMFNADTQETVTQYFFTVPTEDLDVALHIEAIRMRGVLDSERLWKQEKGAIEQEVTRDLSDPEYVFYTKLVASMFKGTPYAHTPLGTVSSFEKTTGTMLKAFHNTWYVPNNAILVIAGNVIPGEAMALVKSHFGGIPAKNIPERPAVRRSVAPSGVVLMYVASLQPYMLVIQEKAVVFIPPYRPDSERRHEIINLSRCIIDFGKDRILVWRGRRPYMRIRNRQTRLHEGIHRPGSNDLRRLLGGDNRMERIIDDRLYPA